MHDKPVLRKINITPSKTFFNRKRVYVVAEIEIGNYTYTVRRHCNENIDHVALVENEALKLHKSVMMGERDG